MSEINFLPEKEKEEREKDLVKKRPKKIEFYTPKEKLTKQPDPSSMPTFGKFFKNLAAKLKFKPSPKSAKEKKLELIPDKKPTKKIEIDVKKTKRYNPRTIQTRQPTDKTQLTPDQPPQEETVEDLAGEYSEVDVNLMPWQDPSLARNKKLRVLAIVISLLLVLVWGTMLRISNTNKEKKIKELEDAVSVVDKQLENINVELLSQGSTIAVRQNKFLELFNQLPKWSNFFTWLESRTDPNVYFTNLSVKGPVVILDASTLDYTTAAKQWLAFETATSWVGSVGVNEFKLISSEDLTEPDKIEFKLDLSINEEALLSNL
jgi:Tfp pilus assembly protein PilN